MKKSIFGIVLVGGIITIAACAKMIINTKKKNNIKKENKNADDTKPTEIVIHRVGIPDEDNDEIKEDVIDDKFDEDVNSRTETDEHANLKKYENIIGFNKTVIRYDLVPCLEKYYKKYKNVVTEVACAKNSESLSQDTCSEVPLSVIRNNVIGLYKPVDTNNVIISTEITIGIETSADFFDDIIIRVNTRFVNGDDPEIFSMIVRRCGHIRDTVGEYELICQPTGDSNHECVLRYDIGNGTIEYVYINDDVLNDCLCGVKQINQFS